MGGTAVDRVHIFRSGTTWCYSAWVRGEYDHSDTLDADCEDLARLEVLAHYPQATVHRVADMVD